MNFTSGGKIISIECQTQNVVDIQNLTVTRVIGGIVDFNAANKKNKDLPLRVSLTDSLFLKNDAQSMSVITVNENSELDVSNSRFEENFSFDKGGVIRGDYTWTKTRIRDSNFTYNGAFSGGVFAVLSQSLLICDNCLISKNFAVVAAVSYSGIHGTFQLINSTV